MSTTEQRFAEYEEALKKAQSYDLNAFQNTFQKDYGEATKYNQDLINQQSTALGQLQSVAPTLRQKYANSLITNPTDQMALIAQARQAPLMDYSNAVNLLSARGNKYQDILGKALGGYQTSANQANTNAENLWRLYQDAVQQDQFNRQLRASQQPKGLSIEDIKNALGLGDDIQLQQDDVEVEDTERTPAQIKMDNKISAARSLINKDLPYLERLGNYYKTAVDPNQGGSWTNLLNPIYGIATGTVAFNELLNRWKK